MKVRSRRHGTGSQHYYGCAWHQERGPVCANGRDVPMFDADAIVIEALLEDVLSPDMLRDAVAEAVALVCGPARDPTPTRSIQREIAKLERERQNYIAAIGAGGQLAGLLDALRDREQRLTALRAQLLALRVREALASMRDGSNATSTTSPRSGATSWPKGRRRRGRSSRPC